MVDRPGPSMPDDEDDEPLPTPRQGVGVPCPWCGATLPHDATGAPSACVSCGNELPPEQAPGNPWWTRALAESTAAQRDPFAEGEERLRGLTPTHWSGPAHDGFLSERDGLVGQWRSALDVHDAVSQRIDGHNQYVHELQHLWEADRGNPIAQRHSAEVYRTAVSSLAEELVRRAAELDALAQAPTPAVAVTEPERPSEPAPEPEPQPEPEARPEPESKPEPEVRPEREVRPVHEVGSEPAEYRDQPPAGGVDLPAHADGQAFFQARRQAVARLEEELLAGRHLTRIKWSEDPAA